MAVAFNEKTNLFTARFTQRDPVTGMPRAFTRTKIRTQREAERAMNELRVEAARFFDARTGKTILYVQVLEQFYHSLEERDVSQAYLENYKLCLNAHTRERWEQRTIESIRTEEIRQLIKGDLNHRSASHRKSILKYLRGVFNFAVEQGYISKSPVPIMQFRIGTKLKQVLNERQAAHLLNMAKIAEHDWYEVWATAIFTGMRNEELYALTRQNVDIENRKIYVRQTWTKKGGFKDLTKTGEDRVVEIAPALVELLKEHWAKNPDSAYALPRIDTWDAGRQAEILRNFTTGLGLPSVNFHALRASWATIMLGKGTELVRVMKMGGWKNLKVLNDHYLRLSGIDIRGMTDVLDFHNPLQ